MAVIQPGTSVPEFSLAAEDGGRFTHEDLAGTPTILVFYPFAFSSVCTDQLSPYQEVLPEIEARGAQIIAVSCDATESQRAFRESLGSTIRDDFQGGVRGGIATAPTVVVDGVLHPGVPDSNLLDELAALR